MPEGRDSIVEIQSMLDRLDSFDPSNRSISKVPDFLRGVNEEAYDPTIVAIGPIHHNKNNVQSMQQHKVWYLRQLLQRKGREQYDLENGGAAEGSNSYDSEKYEKPLLASYLSELGSLEANARKYYSSSIQLPNKEKLVEMLLLDGVFVIELARKWSLKLKNGNCIRKDDYIFQYTEVHYNEVLIQIRRDLLMIENQVPFIILKNVFDWTKGRSDIVDNLQHLLLQFFNRIIPGEPEVDLKRADYIVYDHLFGLVYQAFFSPTIIYPKAKFSRFHEINSTSELQRAGIKFIKTEKTTLMNVQFKDGVLEIPKLEVGDVTESIFRNLIAYEQIWVDDDQTKADDNNPRYVTEYCFLMQFLVNSSKDVEILRRAGIVINWMGDDETVHLFFNKLTKNVAKSQEFYYAKIITDMNEYSGRLRTKFLVDFKRKYLKGPWAITSVVAALILLLLTFAQVVLALLSYKYGTPTKYASRS